MTDFGVFECHIQSITSLHITNYLGEALQALFFRWLDGVNPALASQLHQKNGHDTKLYALSDVMVGHAPLRGAIEPGQSAWFEVVGLRADVVEALKQRLLIAPAAGVEIDYTFWVFNGAALKKAISIAELIQAHHTAPPPQRLTLHFLTPTMFKRKGMALPMPIPTLVFPTLQRRWTEITGLALPDALNLFLDYFVSIEDYHLDTNSNRVQGGLTQGFTGDITYRIWLQSEQLRKDAKNQANAAQLLAYIEETPTRRDELARALGLLADFATYAGVGQKTTHGMGRVIRA